MNDALKGFKEKQDQLAGLLDQASGIAAGLGHDATASQLSAQAGFAREFRFKIAVVGEFSAGKSTLLNAFLGRELLPAKMPPCTAAPVSITFDDSERLMVYRKGVPVPEERPFSALRDLVVLKAEKEEEIARELASSDIERIEVRAPLEICRNRVWLFDTPGLNEAQSRTAITLALLPAVDAAVVLTSALHLLSQTEREFLALEAGKDPADRKWMAASFVVATFADVALQDGPLDELKRRLDVFCDALIPGGLAAGRRFFVDSRSVVLQRAGKASSGDGVEFDRLERALGEFVIRERGEAGLRSQLLSAQKGLTDALSLLAAECRALGQDADKTRGEVESARAALRGERSRLERMAAGLRRLGQRCARDLANSFRADSSRWIQLELAASLASQTYPDTIIVNVKKPAKWFSDRAIEWLEGRIQHWTNEVPPAMLKELLEEFEDAYRDDLADMKRNLGEIGRTMGFSVGVDATVEEGSLAWLLRSAAGMLAGGPLGAIVGATLGWKGVMANLGVNFGLALAAGLAGLSIPVVGWIVIAAAVAAFQIFVGQSGIQERLRGKVLESLQKALPPKMEEAAVAVESGAKIQVEELAKLLTDSGTALIAQLEAATTAAENAANRGDADRQARVRAIADAQVALGALQAQIERLA